MKATKSFFLLLGLVIILSSTAMALSFWQGSHQQNFTTATIPKTDQNSLQSESNPGAKDNDIFDSKAMAKFDKDAVFGLIKEYFYDADKDELTIKFDQALWLIGDEAEKQARSDLGCGKPSEPESCKQDGSILDNTHYIYNPINKIYTYKFNDKTEARIVNYNAQNEQGYRRVSAQEFYEHLQSNQPDDYSEYFQPVWLTEKSGWVTEIQEQSAP